jgi:hypothetical protein
MLLLSSTESFMLKVDIPIDVVGTVNIIYSGKPNCPLEKKLKGILFWAITSFVNLALPDFPLTGVFDSTIGHGLHPIP